MVSAERGSPEKKLVVARSDDWDELQSLVRNNVEHAFEVLQ